MLHQVDVVLATFTPDFERFALKLACCPGDDVISINSPTIQINDTVELNYLLDDEQQCQCQYDGMGEHRHDGLPIVDDRIGLTVSLSIRKCGVMGDTMQSVIVNQMETTSCDSIEVEILKKKMKNLVEDGTCSNA